MKRLNPRLILSYLNTQAIIHRTPQIEAEASLTAFLNTVGIDAGGQNIKTVKDQLTWLSAENAQARLLSGARKT